MYVKRERAVTDTLNKLQIPGLTNSSPSLQLLEIIGSYFHEQSKDALRQLVFSSLFKPRGNMADPARLSLLSRLLSMAVAVARAPVLDCTAVWMQVPARLPNSHTLKLLSGAT
uniref:Uncharacterized protein n=1 Tax=Eptatretus burgeri TaxID=7764 RepID=A0A8C4QBR1_EPTBU